MAKSKTISIESRYKFCKYTPNLLETDCNTVFS